MSLDLAKIRSRPDLTASLVRSGWRRAISKVFPYSFQWYNLWSCERTTNLYVELWFWNTASYLVRGHPTLSWALENLMLEIGHQKIRDMMSFAKDYPMFDPFLVACSWLTAACMKSHHPFLPGSNLIQQETLISYSLSEGGYGREDGDPLHAKL